MSVNPGLYFDNIAARLIQQDETGAAAYCYRIEGSMYTWPDEKPLRDVYTRSSMAKMNEWPEPSIQPGGEVRLGDRGEGTGPGK